MLCTNKIANKIMNKKALDHVLNLLSNACFDDVKNILLGNNYEKIYKQCKKASKYCKSKKVRENCILYLGYCFQYVTMNYDEMKKHYISLVKKGNNIAMNNLGYYYENIETDYPNAIKYYLMAIEKGDSEAMYNLGCYYDDIEKNYEEAIKYYLMAIEKGNSNAMCNLATYYDNIEKSYAKAIKYYLMAIEKGDNASMYKFGVYYEDIEKNYSEASRYYSMMQDKTKHNEFLARYFRHIMGNIEQINNVNVTKEDNKCIICLTNASKFIFNFRCNNKHDHFYCVSCVKQWYSENKTECLACFSPIDPNAIILCVKT